MRYYICTLYTRGEGEGLRLDVGARSPMAAFRLLERKGLLPPEDEVVRLEIRDDGPLLRQPDHMEEEQ